MSSTLSVSCLFAFVAAAGVASAGPIGPGHPGKHAPAKAVAQPISHPNTDGAPFFDNFDSYVAGSNIVGQGGWETWYLGTPTSAFVDNSTAASAPNSMRDVAFSDIVQRFSVAGGKWVAKAKVYVPSTAAPGVGGFFIMMNQYQTPVDNWSIQVAFNDTSQATNTVPYMVESQFDGGLLPLVLDQWVEIRAEIDLVNDKVSLFYNNQQLGVEHLWTDNAFASGPGTLTIANFDLYSNGINPFYFDDVSLQPGGCYPDCDLNNALNINDFICFQTKFALGDAYADCDNNGTRNINDFICFQTKFALGCP